MKNPSFGVSFFLFCDHEGSGLPYRDEQTALADDFDFYWVPRTCVLMSKFDKYRYDLLTFINSVGLSQCLTHKTNLTNHISEIESLLQPIDLFHSRQSLIGWVYNWTVFAVWPKGDFLQPVTLSTIWWGGYNFLKRINMNEFLVISPAICSLLIVLLMSLCETDSFHNTWRGVEINSKLYINYLFK